MSSFFIGLLQLLVQLLVVKYRVDCRVSRIKCKSAVARQSPTNESFTPISEMVSICL